MNQAVQGANKEMEITLEAQDRYNRRWLCCSFFWTVLAAYMFYSTFGNPFALIKWEKVHTQRPEQMTDFYGKDEIGDEIDPSQVLESEFETQLDQQNEEQLEDNMQIDEAEEEFGNNNEEQFYD